MVFAMELNILDFARFPIKHRKREIIYVHILKNSKWKQKKGLSMVDFFFLDD